MDPRPLRVLITGAGRGLGRGVSRLLAKAGHDVFLLDNDAAELQHTLSKHLPGHAPSARFDGRQCDVSDIGSVRRALEAARHFHRDGKIDVLINNAARTGPYWQSVESLASPLSEAQDDQVLEEWNNYMDVNLTGSFNMARSSIALLKRDGQLDSDDWDKVRPSIIFISSTRAKQSEPNHEAYATTKAGLLGLNHALASSLTPVGIRSNAILPGWIPSQHESKQGDEQGASWSDDLTDEDHSQHWSGRVGRIEDLYNAVLFLSQTGFANGQEIVLDGGMTRKMQYAE